MKPAFVLGTELPRATAVIRSLGRAGIPVVAVDHRMNMPGAFSRHVRERLIEPHEARGESDKQGSASRWFFSREQALERLERLGRERGGGVLFPTNDEYMLLVSQNHERLSRWFETTVSPWERLERVMAKRPSYDLAAGAGVRVPDHFPLDGDDSAKSILGALDYRSRSFVFKLDPWARGPADPRSGAMTRPAGPDARTALERARDIHARTGDWPLVQEVVPGDASVCVTATLVLDPSLAVRTAYCSRRIVLSTYSLGGETVHPYELGQSVYAESTRDDEALDAACRIARAAGVHGPVTVEYRRRGDDGGLRFIKVDPRCINATSLSDAVGVRVPVAAYRAALGLPVERPRRIPGGVAWIWLDRYWRTVSTNRERKPVRRELMRVLRRTHRLRAFAYLSRDDPGPFRRAWQMERAWHRKNR